MRWEVIETLVAFSSVQFSSVAQSCLTLQPHEPCCLFSKLMQENQGGNKYKNKGPIVPEEVPYLEPNAY